ncbi:NAD-binding protein [Moellerella wisconsensis]|uniref:NAD-binding protein n=1 Tax=Moellerella wisconsensis TaxID=158849 RepID=A0ACD3Y8D6_9GAMM|nr:ion channel [Moellerella wisconsensis]UNH38366.1 NAD-binding protein [Moellerella wisconsensis]
MLSNPIIIFFKRFVSIRLLLSVLIIVDGFLIINPIINTYTAYIDWRASGFTEWLKSLGIMKLLDIPRFILGISLIFLSFFMLTGARVAWLFAAFLLAIMTFLDLRVAQEHIAQGWFSLALFVSLGVFWKQYPHHSLTSAGFVAVICIVALLIYSIFGTLYIGTEFSPNIKDVPTALYFALVCMTTVGFGDIVPISVDARMFTVTVIIFGITIFTTSVVYVVGVVAKGTQEIVRKRLSHMKDHYVVIGSTPLAIHLYNGLKQRGLPVAVLCREEYRHIFPEKDNIITGDPSNTDILNAAYIKTAKSILIMTDNDALNTFTFLATKELALPTAKIMVMVNQDDNMDKIRRLHPDMMFSLSSLSAQVLMKMLCGETITNSVIDDFLINNVVEK